MSRRVYVCCKECDYKVVEKYVGCEHQFKGSSSRSAAPLARFFEGPDGKTYVPAKAGDPMPARLKKLGYTERTISTAAEYSAAMKKMDQKAIREHEQYTETLHERFEAQQKEERAEMRRSLTTQLGRDLYEEAVRRNEQSYGQRYDPGSHIDGFEN